MKRKFILLVVASMLFYSMNEVSAQINPDRQWTAYRGILSSGVLDNANLPETFDFMKMINIRWKTEVPGLGLSSPVIWGDKIFITSAVSQLDKEGFKPGIYGDITPVRDSSVHEWKVYCYDKNTGKMIWGETAYKGIPKMKRHPKSTHANTSVATDGNFVVAFFGSEGLFCYNMNGKLVWQKNFGLLKSVFFMVKSAEWEFASSPIIYNGVLIIFIFSGFISSIGKKMARSSANLNHFPSASRKSFLAIFLNNHTFHVRGCKGRNGSRR